MKKNIIYKIHLFLCIVFSIFSISAQQTNTMYFMENVPVRNALNPAFQPLSNFYLGFPILGYTQFGVGNNSLTLKDLVYKNPNGGIPIWFLNQNGDKDKFYNTLKSNTLLGTNLQVNLLDFGFRKGEAYWSFSLTEKVDANGLIPKDLMKLLLYGTPDIIENNYKLKSLGFDMTAYTEVALGYSRIIDDKWTVGGKLKFLYGSANASVKNTNFDMTAGVDQWLLNGNGNLNYSSAFELQGDSLKNLKLKEPNSSSDYFKPAGLGAGIDLGVTFKPINNLTVSASLTDLGVIRWSKNAKNINYSTNYTFTGLGKLKLGDNKTFTGLNIGDNFDDFKTVLEDSILTPIINSMTTNMTTNSYSTYTKPKLNIGAEYGFFDNKLSLGLLSRTTSYNKRYFEELTASVNGRPIDWFNMSLSYSVMNGRMSNVGAGLGLRTGFINWFVSADYIPLSYANLPLKELSSSLPTFDMPVPYNNNKFNVAFGVNLVFGNRKDADKDGVVDRKDKCPETPLGVFVDKKGCPVDNDGDSIPDYLDNCPGTPKEAYGKIDAHGCPLDTDGDSIPDYLDKCPDTPAQSIGFVDKDGCSLDTDKDGVFDYLDKCANTPAGVVVDSVGCPVDSDGDSVADYLDLCPETPSQARGMVDKNGCPLDTDGDGVLDYLDLCPGTPIEERGFVDKNGCSLDSDDDGIPDYLDKCPNTPKEARGMVDEKGCPRDIDGDGVYDYMDNCPKVPGLASNKGCPEVKKEVKKLFQKALQGIQFETGKSVIKKTSFTILNQIAQVLIANSGYLIEIQGHTDNVGKPASNLILSDKRAAAVRDYLIGKGVNEKRMTSKGFGDTKPVANNKTTAGKAKNRRVEFIVSFEEVSFD